MAPIAEVRAVVVKYTYLYPERVEAMIQRMMTLYIRLEFTIKQQPIDWSNCAAVEAQLRKDLGL